MIPNPGTEEAIKQGCKCTEPFNPYMYDIGCPVHDSKVAEELAEQDERESRSEQRDQDALRNGG